MSINAIDPLYKKVVEICIEQKSNLEIPNHDFITAFFIYQKIFEISQEKICIFARGIKEEIFDQNVVSKAIAFLKRNGTQLEIIYRFKDDRDKQRNEESKFITAIREYKNKVQIKSQKGDGDWCKKIKSFTLGDKNIYRVRRTIDRQENKGDAWVNFNNKSETKKYQDIFDKQMK